MMKLGTEIYLCVKMVSKINTGKLLMEVIERTRNMTEAEKEESDITFRYLRMCEVLNLPIKHNTIDEMKTELQNNINRNVNN